ncbi:MAG: hypothetical protein ACI93R_000400 [Flavobacteriales bacterium]|jgi:hypothetical protein
MKSTPMYSLVIASKLETSMGTRTKKNRNKYLKTYNIMAWLETRTPFTGSAKLNLTYTDQAGDHCVNIDKIVCNNSELILLSSQCTIDVVGNIKCAYMSLDTLKEHKFNAIEASITPQKTCSERRPETQV